MKKYLEKILHTIIPHKKNGDVPHILRKEFIVVLAIFVGALFYFNQNNFSIIKNLNLTAAVYPAVLADLANQDRATSGVQKLAWNDVLQSGAKLKADDMLKNSYFAHTSPSGVTPWHWLKEVNYNFTYAGENLAVDFIESANVEDAWLNSPKHRENILNSHFTEIGIATADGFFEGKNTTFVVEFFGSPSKVITAEKPITNKVAINNTDKVVTPSVAGVSSENVAQEDNIKVVEENDKLIVVKNENAVEKTPEIPLNLENKPISTWYARFVVSPTNTIRIIYTIIFGFILVAVLLMLSKEYHKHHTKHLVMGIFLMFIISSLLYIISTNSTQIFF